MRQLFLVCWCAALLALGGCGPSGPDALVKEQIRVMNDMATAMETDAAADKLAELQLRTAEINKKMEALNLSEADKQKLLERHKADLTAAVERLQKAMLAKAMKGGGFPGFPKVGEK